MKTTKLQNEIAESMQDFLAKLPGQQEPAIQKSASDNRSYFTKVAAALTVIAEELDAAGAQDLADLTDAALADFVDTAK